MSGYAILRKTRVAPPQDIEVLEYLPKNLNQYGGTCAIDFETHGIDPTLGTIRSVAIANDYGAIAIDCEKLSKGDRLILTNWLMEQDLIAHNAVFDAGWLYAKTGKMPKIEACTLVLFKLLATEGYLGQRWGLKSAMTELLGWPESNETDLYGWLKDNKLKAKDMAQAPWDVLGKYNVLDAAATWQLYKYLRSFIEENNWEAQILKFHKEDFRNLMELLIEQQIGGMHIDLKGLEDFDKKLEAEIEEKRQEFLNHGEVKSHVQYYQSVIIEEIEKAMPPQYTKKGEVTARYTKWQERLAAANSRIDFNIDSPKQLQWLFYERLFYDCPIKTDKGVTSVGKKAFPHLGHLGKLMKQYRELRDRRKFVTALTNVQRDGILYPTVKPHGTVTGRCSGGVG